ncbi:MAG TPA: Clp protease N-terminal domain-containing protein [Longimicrobium sp.]|nr:Clp protease N-terminal domain-containing protein [Longimicrobium sp.]
MFGKIFGGGQGASFTAGAGQQFNFDDDVRGALGNAREEALEMGHTQVGTEHILLGLLRSPEYESVRLLRTLGVDPEKVWRYVKEAVPAGRSSKAARNGVLPYTTGAKRVLELSMDEARTGGGHDITLRHLLIAVLREEKGVGARALATFGVSPEALRAARAAAGAAFGIHVDDASDRSIYEQIVAQVQEAAATGRARAGERLPSVRALADELDVAPGTVARAYAELERLGVVVTDGARGTRIAARPVEASARVDDLAGMIRPAVVAAYHQGATAADLRAALDRAMEGIYPEDGGGDAGVLAPV